MMDTVLQRWIAELYLTDRKIRSLVESAAANPVAQYLVLDDFFRPEAIERLRDHCDTLRFNTDDRIGGSSRYADRSVKYADSSDVGWDLFNDPEWHAYCAKLLGATITDPSRHEARFVFQEADSTGLWVHKDGTPGKRSLSLIAYFNEGWRVEDGALLRIWRESETSAPGVTTIDAPEQLLVNRFRTSTAHGFGVEPKLREFVLVDQIVPEYNRIFLCNTQTRPAWHSVTPSNGRARYGFLQWIG